MFKTYQDSDFVFVDQNGLEYISTPQFDTMGAIGQIILVMALGNLSMILVMFYYFGGSK